MVRVASNHHSILVQCNIRDNLYGEYGNVKYQKFDFSVGTFEGQFRSLEIIDSLPLFRKV